MAGGCELHTFGSGEREIMCSGEQGNGFSDFLKGDDSFKNESAI
jgi:hypothetical protein